MIGRSKGASIADCRRIIRPCPLTCWGKEPAPTRMPIQRYGTVIPFHDGGYESAVVLV
jgi:hypothetical protein